MNRFATLSTRAASRTCLFRVVAPVQAQARSMAIDMKGRDSAKEADYFNREDRQKMRDLLEKMQLKADPDLAKMRAALKVILAKHNVTVTQALLDDLRSWRLKGSSSVLPK